MSPSVISPVEKVSSLLLDTRWVSAWEKSYSTTFKIYKFWFSKAFFLAKYFFPFFTKAVHGEKSAAIRFDLIFFQTQNSSEIILVCALWNYFIANSNIILGGGGKDYIG